jgi:peptidoglycan/xylan/chitin deacetylase (PgdA/CDA1 family)
MASVLAGVLYASGLVHVWMLIRRRVFRRYGVYVLSYHHVVNGEAASRHDVTTSQLASHLRFVSRWFHLVRCEDIPDLLESPRLDRDYLAVTFDDGYEDNYRHALPLLRQRGTPGTTFLIAGLAGTTDIPWYDECRLRMAALEEGSVVIEESKTRAMRIMTWEQAREMTDHGMSFGSHTVTHPILTALSTSEIEAELLASRVTIERELGASCATFAFPNGDFDDRCVDLLRAHGFRAAFTQIFGVNRPGDNTLRLKRIGVGRTPVWVLAAKLSGLFTPAYAVRQMWQSRQSKRAFV